VPDQQTGSAAEFDDFIRRKRMKRLAEFLKSAERTSNLSRQDRLRIVEQALLLLEMNYVHLPLKQAMHAINPIQRLKLLKYRLETKPKDLEPIMRFHNRMLDIFASLRDVHTAYFLPTPFADQVAFLPFLVEQYFESDGKGGRAEKFLITRVMDQILEKSAATGAAAFERGVEVLYWNGVPIGRSIELNGENQAGSNPEARVARGLDNLTVRPLDTSLPPDEKWVDITYQTKAGKVSSMKLEWLVYDKAGQRRAAKSTEKKRAAIDVKKAKINEFKKQFFARARPVRVKDEFKDNFYYETRTVGGHDFGYIRLFSFDVTDKREIINGFVNEVRRVITDKQFPQEGLIIDVRGNPGGTIRAGERLLQLFTPRRIKPEPFQFINTPLNLEICRKAQKRKDLFRWADSIAESVKTGAPYSTGFPLQPEAWCNEIGQVYYGPVILITDALSYSTTDIFAAGFQDHAIGEILGTSDNTGAGGANMWYYQDLIDALGTGARTRFKSLPGDTAFQLAMRRSVRVGPHEGRPLEELGVTPDHRYFMTKNDLMHNNGSLVRQAARLLQTKPTYELSVRAVKGGVRALRISASSTVRASDRRRQIKRVDVFLNGGPFKSLSAAKGILRPTTVTLGKSPKFDWLVQAVDRDNNLVASARRHRSI
jgi:C-terminal processing protease CtpA/Prc